MSAASPVGVDSIRQLSTHRCRWRERSERPQRDSDQTIGACIRSARRYPDVHRVARSACGRGLASSYACSPAPIPFRDVVSRRAALATDLTRLVATPGAVSGCGDFGHGNRLGHWSAATGRNYTLPVLSHCEILNYS